MSDLARPDVPKAPGLGTPGAATPAEAERQGKTDQDAPKDVTNQNPNNENKDKPEAPKAKSGTKFFRSRLAGLAIVVGESDPLHPVAPETVRFVPHYERYQGDRVTVGYLATDNKRALEVLATDGNVEEISAKEYKDATEGKDSQRASY